MTHDRKIDYELHGMGESSHEPKIYVWNKGIMIGYAYEIENGIWLAFDYTTITNCRVEHRFPNRESARNFLLRNCMPLD